MVYPRERGETAVRGNPASTASGLSPRTRGNRRDLVGTRAQHRSIPANAGKPSSSRPRGRARRVYPRERGETHLVNDGFLPTLGLSPRTRGNPRKRRARNSSSGSIPANAGKPWQSARRSAMVPVYPRERGETSDAGRWMGLFPGLSPRTRGNPRAETGRIPAGGSIPANAGKPVAPGNYRQSHRVYPRERGETRASSARVSSARGLSPRTRETHGGWRRRREPPGLSPRTRGNQGEGCPPPVRARSIPANAGKPGWLISCTGRSGVYPRERGETASSAVATVTVSGLSPRTRGNPPHLGHPRLKLRSIPANAGKPTMGASSPPIARVYPRERGETAAGAQIVFNFQGLSPRTRGNQLQLGATAADEGSIPANAGKPSTRRTPSIPPWVYPRERGETFVAADVRPADTGLSPRTRGNPATVTPSSA